MSEESIENKKEKKVENDQYGFFVYYKFCQVILELLSILRTSF